MPLYEYRCPQHGRFELVRKFADPPLTKCPTCGKKVEKLFSAPAIQFKGSGWYITDYARKSSGDGKDAGKEGKKDTADKDSGSKDSGSKDTGSKDTASKDTASTKDAASKESSPKSTAKTGTTGGGSSGSSD